MTEVVYRPKSNLQQDLISLLALNAFRLNSITTQGHAQPVCLSHFSTFFIHRLSASRSAWSQWPGNANVMETMNPMSAQKFLASIPRPPQVQVAIVNEHGTKHVTVGMNTILRTAAFSQAVDIVLSDLPLHLMGHIMIHTGGIVVLLDVGLLEDEPLQDEQVLIVDKVRLHHPHRTPPCQGNLAHRTPTVLKIALLVDEIPLHRHKVTLRWRGLAHRISSAANQEIPSHPGPWLPLTSVKPCIERRIAVAILTACRICTS